MEGDTLLLSLSTAVIAFFKLGILLLFFQMREKNDSTYNSWIGKCVL